MLDHAGQQIVALEHDLVAVEVDATHRHVLGPDDLEPEAGNGQTAFLGLDLALRVDDLGVDHYSWAVALVEVVGEETLAHADLRGGETHSVGTVHRLVHAVHEWNEVGGDLLDRARGLLQHGIAEETERVTGHATQVIRTPSRFGVVGWRSVPSGNAKTKVGSGAA